VVDLSQVQDVRDGRQATGRPNSIQLLTAKGASVCFLCDTGAARPGPAAAGCLGTSGGRSPRQGGHAATGPAAPIYAPPVILSPTPNGPQTLAPNPGRAETEMVEWISAMEGAIARIVRALAGV
jgi:hypothetical protein